MRSLLRHLHDALASALGPWGQVADTAKAHAPMADALWTAAGAVLEPVPYIGSAYGLCNEVIKLFSAGIHINSNCQEVVRWAKNMQVRHSHCCSISQQARTLSARTLLQHACPVLCRQRPSRAALCV